MVPILLILTPIGLFLTLVVIAKLRLGRAGMSSQAQIAFREHRRALLRRFYPFNLLYFSISAFASCCALLYTNTPLVIRAVLVEAGFWCLLISWYMYASRNNRFRNEVMQGKYRFCTRCLYNLSGHGESGTCPECGAAFTEEILREAWSNINIE